MCVGIAGRVVAIVDAEHDLVRVDVDGRVQDVSVALLTPEGPVSVDDWVLVHMGFAMARTDEQEAADTYRMMEELVRAYDDEVQGVAEDRMHDPPSPAGRRADA